MLELSLPLRLLRYSLVKIFPKCAQASEDSVVLNLEDALSKAYEEIADLRRRVLELEAQATELFRSNSTQGKLFKLQATMAYSNQILLTHINKSETFVGTFQGL